MTLSTPLSRVAYCEYASRPRPIHRDQSACEIWTA